jgi:hypothetical protein
MRDLCRQLLRGPRDCTYYVRASPLLLEDDKGNLTLEADGTHAAIDVRMTTPLALAASSLFGPTPTRITDAAKKLAEHYDAVGRCMVMELALTIGFLVQETNLGALTTSRLLDQMPQLRAGLVQLHELALFQLRQLGFPKSAHNKPLWTAAIERAGHSKTCGILVKNETTIMYRVVGLPGFNDDDDDSDPTFCLLPPHRVAARRVRLSTSALSQCAQHRRATYFAGGVRWRYQCAPGAR